MRRFQIAMAIVAVAGVLAAGEAGADGKSEASDRFKKGVTLYKAGDYEGALVEFKAAYEAEPHFKVKYNIGMTLYQLHRYVDAEGELMTYLSDGGDEVPDEKKQEVQAVLFEIMGYVGTLLVNCEVSGAGLYLDGEFVASLPMTVPVRLDVGEYSVEVRADGYSTFHQKVTLPGGKQVSVEAELAELAGKGGAVTEKIVEKVVLAGECDEDRDCTLKRDVCYAGKCMTEGHRNDLLKRGKPKIVGGGIMIGLLGIPPIAIGIALLGVGAAEGTQQIGPSLTAPSYFSAHPGMLAIDIILMVVGAAFIAGGGVLVHQGLLVRKEADSLKGKDEEGEESAGLGMEPWRLVPFAGPIAGGGHGVTAGLSMVF